MECVVKSVVVSIGVRIQLFDIELLAKIRHNKIESVDNWQRFITAYITTRLQQKQFNKSNY